MSEKTTLIKSVWADGRGVIPLHVFQAALSEEAFVREACMIEAIGNNTYTPIYFLLTLFRVALSGKCKERATTWVGLLLASTEAARLWYLSSVENV